MHVTALATYLNVEASYATFDHEDGFNQYHAGTHIWKAADDLARYRMAIEAARPDVLVESGTRWGGLAAWVADQGVQVVTVDIEQTKGRPKSWPGVTFIVGDSLAGATLDQVGALTSGKRTMVSLDSDHHAPHVRAEIEAYGQFVSAGCHLVVEDGLADLVGARRSRRFGARCPQVGGPLRAITETLAGNPQWVRDEEIERMSEITHSPAGWWRRVG